MSKIKYNLQRGFTLIEMIIVVVVIGILISVFLPLIKDAVSPSKSVALLRAAEQIHQTFQLISRQCGTSTTVTSTPLAPNPKTISDVIFGGSANVAAAYTSCYAQSQAKALTEIGQPSSTAGVYNVQGYAVSLAGGGPNPVAVSFASVENEIVFSMARKYTPSLTALATSDALSPVIQYGSETSGARTVTVIKQ